MPGREQGTAQGIGQHIDQGGKVFRQADNAEVGRMGVGAKGQVAANILHGGIKGVKGVAAAAAREHGRHQARQPGLIGPLLPCGGGEAAMQYSHRCGVVFTHEHGQPIGQENAGDVTRIWEHTSLPSAVHG